MAWWVIQGSTCHSRRSSQFRPGRGRVEPSRLAGRHANRGRHPAHHKRCSHLQLDHQRNAGRSSVKTHVDLPQNRTLFDIVCPALTRTGCQSSCRRSRTSSAGPCSVPAPISFLFASKSWFQAGRKVSCSRTSVRPTPGCWMTSIPCRPGKVSGSISAARCGLLRSTWRSPRR